MRIQSCWIIVGEGGADRAAVQIPPKCAITNTLMNIRRWDCDTISSGAATKQTAAKTAMKRRIVSQAAGSSGLSRPRAAQKTATEAKSDTAPASSLPLKDAAPLALRKHCRAAKAASGTIRTQS